MADIAFFRLSLGASVFSWVGVPMFMCVCACPNPLVPQCTCGHARICWFAEDDTCGDMAVKFEFFVRFLWVPEEKRSANVEAIVGELVFAGLLCFCMFAPTVGHTHVI